MKLSKLTKGLFAASVLTVASFGANATAISSAVLNVTGFGLAVDDGAGSAPALTWTLKNDATFNGVTQTQTNVSALTPVSSDPADGAEGDPALVCGGPDCGVMGENDIDFNQFGLADDLDFASSDSYVFTGPGGTDASSRADTSINTVSNGSLQTAGSEIQNSITTGITFDVGNSGSVQFFYSYVAQIAAQISADWLNPNHNTQADSNFGLAFSLTKKGSNAGSIADIGGSNFLALSSFGLSQSKNANNDGGAKEDFTDNKLVQLTGLDEGTYRLVISHDTSASSKHTAIPVPEPSSIAILGLGLLGFAGVSRRRKS
ncbi:MAG: hypothetical protein ACI8UG_000657 [Gammaproteobacteria bacterium]|jgi:hypothetical protein